MFVFLLPVLSKEMVAGEGHSDFKMTLHSFVTMLEFLLGCFLRMYAMHLAKALFMFSFDLYPELETDAVNQSN